MNMRVDLREELSSEKDEDVTFWMDWCLGIMIVYFDF